MVFGCLTDKLCNLWKAAHSEAKLFTIFYSSYVLLGFFTVLTCIIFETDVLYTTVLQLASTYKVDIIPLSREQCTGLLFNFETFWPKVTAHKNRISPS